MTSPRNGQLTFKFICHPVITLSPGVMYIKIDLHTHKYMLFAGWEVGMVKNCD